MKKKNVQSPKLQPVKPKDLDEKDLDQVRGGDGSAGTTSGPKIPSSLGSGFDSNIETWGDWPVLTKRVPR